MPARRLDADTALEISLNGTARRLTREGRDWAEAVAELKALANGRSDLLARAAGSMIGGYLGSPGMTPPDQIKAAALLIGAGADPSEVTTAVDRVRANVTSGGHSTPA